MSAYEILTLVQLINIIVLFVECIYIAFHRRTDLHSLLFFVCLVELMNNLGYFFEMTAKSKDVYILALKMSYVGRAWVPFSLFLFTLNLCGIRYKKWIIHILGTIHSITVGLVMTMEYHNLYYRDSRFELEGIAPHMVSSHGPWYIFYHYTVVPSYIFIGLGILIFNLCREKDSLFKKRYATITASIMVESLFFVLTMMRVVKSYDLTMLGYTFGAIIVAIGLFKYDVLETMEMAQDFCLEEIPEGIIIVNQHGKTEYINPQAEKFFSIDINNKKEIKRLIPIFDEKSEAKEPIEIGNKIYRVEKKTLLLKDSYKGAIYVSDDITEVYKYMNALKEQKEIAENARQEAENAYESKSSFVSIVSHEIRTPMNAVIGMTELLLKDKDNLSEKQERYLTNIKNSGISLVSIVNDILDQSKIESGKMEIIEDIYEINPLIEDVKLIIENRIGSKDIKLIADICEDVPKKLIGDSVRIRQVLINLMNNAVKYTDEGFIKISIECIENLLDKVSLKFAISDSGQGIKPEDLDKLGEAFARVNEHKNHSKEGTGLGLSISKSFINMMGGQLEVSSVYGEGSCFFFTIDQKIVDESYEDIEPDTSLENMTCPQANILIVDDNDINLMIAEELMEPLGCSIDTARSGVSAVEMVKNNNYHLVFMDYMMPDIDGAKATAAIREAGYDIPIVALTGDTSETTKDLFTKAGINDFLEKPIQLDTIKDKLCLWLSEELIIK